MSIVITTDNVYNGNKSLPTVLQLNTSAQAVYDSYVARVAADGGTIADTVKVRSAIDFMFASNLYGYIECCISKNYGIKKDASNNILKAYSIVGDDLISMSLGGGALPKLTANGIEFTASSAGLMGSILTTSIKKKRSKAGGMGIAINAKNLVSDPAAHITSLTSNGEYRYDLGAPSILNGTAAGSILFRYPTNPVEPTSSANFYSLVPRTGADNAGFVASADYLKTSMKVFRNGAVEQNYPTNTVGDISNLDLHINIGGYIKTATVFLCSTFTLNDCWYLNNITDDQSVKLSAFISQ